MRKLYSKLAKVAALVFLGTSALAVNAAPTLISYEMGEDFLLPDNNSYAIYEAQSDGVLTAIYPTVGTLEDGTPINGGNGYHKGLQSSNPNSILYQNLLTAAGEIYVAQAIKVPLSASEFNPDNANFYISQSWNVTAGQTYYLYSVSAVTVNLSFEGAEIDDPKENAVEIEMNHPVQLGGENKIGKIVIEEAGVLTAVAMVFPGSSAAAQTGAFLKGEDNQGVESTKGGYMQTGWFQNSSNNTYSATWNLEAGTYYVYYNSEDENTFTFSFVSNNSVIVTLAEISLAPGNVFDVNQTALHNGIKFTFDPAGTTVESAVLKYTNEEGEQTVALTVEDVHEGSWNIGGNDGEISSVVKGMDLDTEFQIVLSGIEWNDKVLSASDIESDYLEIGEDGTLTVTYMSAGEPVKLLSQKWPSELVPYINPGSENGYATLTFNYEMDNVSVELLFYSNYILGAQVEVPGQITIPTVINGETVTIDFTGIDFTQVEGYTPLSSYSVIVQGIKTVNGLKYESFVKNIAYNPNAAENPDPEMETTATMIDPEDTSDALAEAQAIVVTWNYEEIELTDENNTASLVIGSGAPWTCSLELLSVEVDGETPEYSNALQINLPNNFNGAEGVYTFILKSGMVKNAEGEVNPEQTFSYTVDSTTGIGNILVDGANDAIYNLQGVKVQNPAKGGIYIVNGRKVVIK